MAGPFTFITQSRIKEGRLDDFKRSFRDISRFVEANEPRIIAFEAYVSDDGTEVTGVQIHPDADSMAFHLKVASERILEFDQYIDMHSVAIYGVPNETVVAMIEQMAEKFRGSGVSIHVRTNPVGGFTRRVETS